MARFVLAGDLNLGIGRWLRGRGHNVARLDSSESGDPGDSCPRMGAVADEIVVTHDEQLTCVSIGASEACAILIIPQPSLDDIARVAEAVHQVVVSGRATAGTRFRLGLRSGWQPLSERE